jgi:hypothetical protein
MFHEIKERNPNEITDNEARPEPESERFYTGSHHLGSGRRAALKTAFAL